MSKQVNYTELIEKAIPVFWTSGYRSASYKRLAKAMKISPSFLYNQWGKEQLLIDSINDYLARDVDPVLDDIENSEKGIEAIREVFYHLAGAKYDDNPCTCMLMNIALELRHDLPGLLPVYAKFIKHVREVFEKALFRSYKNGKLKKVEGIPDYLEMLVGILFGINQLVEFKSCDELTDYIDSQFALIE